MGIFRKRRATTASVALIASLSMLAACGGSEDPDDNSSDTGPFEIFAMAPLSGPIAAPGAQVKAGLEGAVAVINENGGIGGRDVKLTIVDDAGDPTQVAGHLQTILQADSKPDLVITGLTSTEAVAALPLTNQADILAAGPAASTEMEQFDRYISGTPTSSDASKAALKKIADAGFTKVGVVVVDNVSGISAATDFEKFKDDYGLTITGSEKVSATATDATPQLERLQDGDPEVILYSGFSPVAGEVVKSKFKLGWDVPIYTDHTIGAFPFTTLASPEELADFNVTLPSYVVQGNDAQSTDAIKTAVGAIEKAYGKDFDAPIQAAMHSYMSVILVKYAYEAADSKDAASVWEARTTLTPADTLLYAGSSTLFSESALNWPTFLPEDYSVLVAEQFEHGFAVPRS